MIDQDRAGARAQAIVHRENGVAAGGAADRVPDDDGVSAFLPALDPDENKIVGRGPGDVRAVVAPLVGEWAEARSAHGEHGVGITTDGGIRRLRGDGRRGDDHENRHCACGGAGRIAGHHGVIPRVRPLRVVARVGQVGCSGNVGAIEAPAIRLRRGRAVRRRRKDCGVALGHDEALRLRQEYRIRIGQRHVQHDAAAVALHDGAVGAVAIHDDVVGHAVGNVERERAEDRVAIRVVIPGDDCEIRHRAPRVNRQQRVEVAPERVHAHQPRRRSRPAQPARVTPVAARVTRLAGFASERDVCSANGVRKSEHDPTGCEHVSKGRRRQTHRDRDRIRHPHRSAIIRRLRANAVNAFRHVRPEYAVRAGGIATEERGASIELNQRHGAVRVRSTGGDGDAVARSNDGAIRRAGDRHVGKRIDDDRRRQRCRGGPQIIRRHRRHHIGAYRRIGPSEAMRSRQILADLVRAIHEELHLRDAAIDIRRSRLDGDRRREVHHQPIRGLSQRHGRSLVVIVRNRHRRTRWRANDVIHARTHRQRHRLVAFEQQIIQHQHRDGHGAGTRWNRDRTGERGVIAARNCVAAHGEEHLQRRQRAAGARDGEQAAIRSSLRRRPIRRRDRHARRHGDSEHRHLTDRGADDVRDAHRVSAGSGQLNVVQRQRGVRRAGDVHAIQAPLITQRSASDRLDRKRGGLPDDDVGARWLADNHRRRYDAEGRDHARRAAQLIRHDHTIAASIRELHVREREREIRGARKIRAALLPLVRERRAAFHQHGEDNRAVRGGRLIRRLADDDRRRDQIDDSDDIDGSRRIGDQDAVSADVRRLEVRDRERSPGRTRQEATVEAPFIAQRRGARGCHGQGRVRAGGHTGRRREARNPRRRQHGGTGDCAGGRHASDPVHRIISVTQRAAALE